MNIIQAIIDLDRSVHKFVKIAKDEFETIKAMSKKMKNLYEELAEFFCFDKNSKSFEEFFSQIKTFLEEYQVSLIMTSHKSNS